jgi:molybdenum cofactor biosynthesis protein MoaF
VRDREVAVGADVKGTTVRWTYSDGPMKGKSFEHQFTNDGTVTWKEAGDEKPSADSSGRYQFVRIDDDVYVVSYLSSHGYTLTTVIDEEAGTVVSFASNEKELVVQHGSLDGRKRAT